MKTRLSRWLPLGAFVVSLGWLAAGPSARAETGPAAAGPRVDALSGRLELGQEIRVHILGLGAWAANQDATRLVPIINGRTIRGNYPAEVHTAVEELHFVLAVTPDNQEVWNSLLGEPTSLRKKVDFSVGLEGQTPFASDFHDQRQASLTVISPVYGWISLAVVAVTFVAFVWLARHTGLLRDSDASPVPPNRKPYNLGRAQMAFWFFLTFTSYIVIWLITDDIDTITPSLLGLMGISAGTALSEVLIDANKDAAGAAQLEEAGAERMALEQGIAEQQTQLATLTAKTAPTTDDAVARDSLNRQLLAQRLRLNQLTQQLAALAPAADADVSRGFLRDVLSDGRGYSFHRFQIFAWTIVLGGVFISAVYNRLTMPEFSTTMLGLMGMSSGTYIGFKFPEQR